MIYNRAAFLVKKKAFEGMLDTYITVTSQGYEQNPMYPDDPDQTIPTGSEVETEYKVRFIISASSPEGYKESNAGFMPESYRFILSKSQIQEGSFFSAFDLNWKVGKEQKPVAFGKRYGYRYPIQVV